VLTAKCAEMCSAPRRRHLSEAVGSIGYAELELINGLEVAPIAQMTRWHDERGSATEEPRTPTRRSSCGEVLATSLSPSRNRNVNGEPIYEIVHDEIREASIAAALAKRDREPPAREPSYSSDSCLPLDFSYRYLARQSIPYP